MHALVISFLTNSLDIVSYFNTLMKLATQFLCVCAVTLFVVQEVIARNEEVEDFDRSCTGNFERPSSKGKFDLKSNTIVAVNKKYKIDKLSEFCFCSIEYEYDTITEDLDYLFCRHKVGNELHYSELDRDTMSMVDKGKVL